MFLGGMLNLAPMDTVRVYEPVHRAEGTRVLVDRLWPRGIRKGDPRVGRWLKDVAPSTELRHWYRHDPAKFDEFREAIYRRTPPTGRRGGP